jgi:hypothetical protein
MPFHAHLSDQIAAAYLIAHVPIFHSVTHQLNPSFTAITTKPSMLDENQCLSTVRCVRLDF